MSPDTPTTNKRSLKLLLVDDDVVTNRVLTNLLRKANYNVISAYSGIEALELLYQEDIDAVLLDVMMPDMDGITVLSRIRKNLDLPVLILTASSQQDVIEQAFSNGADDFIVKPFSAQQLLDRINTLTQSISPDVDSTMIISGDLKLTPNNRQFQAGKKTGSLSGIETRLLQHFVRNPNTFLSIEDLLMVGWSRGKKYTMQEREMLKLAINHLREKIEPEIDNPIYLPLVNGEGYIFHPIE
jgi:DNA-binding response OmpR family regulator